MPAPLIDVLVPVLRRPAQIVPLLDSLADAATLPYHVYLLATKGDTPTITASRNEADRRGNITVDTSPPAARGDYARKINKGFRLGSAPFMFLGAGDLRFHWGWDGLALAAMDDPTVGVVGTQDQCNRRVKAGTHSTHSLVRRTYVDEHGTIDEAGKVLHEGYWHEFVDDEFVETAKYRGAFVFCGDAIVEHLHPSAGKAHWDAMYRQEPIRMRQGRVVYARRRQLWAA